MASSAQAFDRIRADLVGVAATRVKAESRFERLRADLLKVRTRSLQRAEFRANADAFFDRIFAAPDYLELAGRVDRTKDPACLATSLLGSLNRTRRETLHTQALGSLLDPRRFAQGELLLGAVLDEIDPGLTDAIVLKWASVHIEHTLAVPKRGRTERPRPDLLVELRKAEGDTPIRVIAIENKIDAIDRDNQLDDYWEAVSLRYPHSDLHFMYLTPHGSAPTQKIEAEWRCLSYETLALILRRQLAILDRSKDVEHGWREILRLYLATVVQDVLRWHVFDQHSRAARWRARRYLQAATHEIGSNNA